MFDICKKALSSFHLKVAISVFVIAALFYFNRIEIIALNHLEFTWPYLLIAFCIMLPPFFIVTLRFLLLLISQRISASFYQVFQWNIIGSFFDILMPSSNGGDFVKCFYVMRHTGTGLRTLSVTLVALDRILGIIGLFILVVIASLLNWDMFEKLPSHNLILLFSCIVGVISILLFLILSSNYIYNNAWLNNFLSSKRLGMYTARLLHVFKLLRSQQMVLFYSLALSAFNHFFWCISIIFIAKAFGHSIEVWQGFMVFPLAIFGGIFGVAGGFGIGTLAFDFLFSMFLGLPDGAVIGLVFQILSLLTKLLGLPFYLTTKQAPSNQ